VFFFFFFKVLELLGFIHVFHLTYKLLIPFYNLYEQLKLSIDSKPGQAQEKVE